MTEDDCACVYIYIGRGHSSAVKCEGFYAVRYEPGGKKEESLKQKEYKVSKKTVRMHWEDELV